MAMEEMMALIQGLPPEQQQQAMQKIQQMQQQGGEMPPAPGMGEMPPAPGMAPPQGQMPPQQPVDPRMGLPGQGGGSPEAFRDYAGESGVIDDQQAQAEALRSTPNAQGIQTQNAGFIASNPLSALATGVSRFKGGLDAREALQAKKDLSALKTTTQQDIAKKILGTKEQAMADELRENRRGYNPSMSA